MDSEQCTNSVQQFSHSTLSSSRQNSRNERLTNSFIFCSFEWMSSPWLAAISSAYSLTESSSIWSQMDTEKCSIHHHSLIQITSLQQVAFAQISRSKINMIYREYQSRIIPVTGRSQFIRQHSLHWRERIEDDPDGRKIGEWELRCLSGTWKSECITNRGKISTTVEPFHTFKWLKYVGSTII